MHKKYIKDLIHIICIAVIVTIISGCVHQTMWVEKEEVSAQDMILKKARQEQKYPYINIRQNPHLERSINQIIQKHIKQYIAQEKKLYPNPKIAQYWLDYRTQIKYKSLFSILFDASSYYPQAAHPNHMQYGLTFDAKTLQVYKLQELFKSPFPEEKINRLLHKTIQEMNIDIFEPFLGLQENQEYYLKHNSLVIFYQRYKYTPYSYGPLEIEIPIHKIYSWLTPEFKKLYRSQKKPKEVIRKKEEEKLQPPEKLTPPDKAKLKNSQKKQKESSGREKRLDGKKKPKVLSTKKNTEEPKPEKKDIRRKPKRRKKVIPYEESLPDQIRKQQQF